MTSRTSLALTWTAIAVVGIVAVAAWLPPRPVYGGAVNPTPNPDEQARDAARVPVLEEGFVGARITASHNQVATDEPLRFDTARWDSGGWWNPDEPTRLTFPDDGICTVHGQVTILGTLYHGAPADDISLLVIRDGDPHAFVAYARLSDEDPGPAHGLNAATTDWFEAGEYIEVLVTPGLTVESNWPGRANVSPILSAACF